MPNPAELQDPVIRKAVYQHYGLDESKEYNFDLENDLISEVPRIGLKGAESTMATPNPLNPSTSPSGPPQNPFNAPSQSETAIR